MRRMLCLLALFAGCGRPGDGLVGLWNEVAPSGPLRAYEFTDDAYRLDDNSGLADHGVWSADGGLVTFSSACLGQTLVVPYDLSGDSLQLGGVRYFRLRTRVLGTVGPSCHP